MKTALSNYCSCQTFAENNFMNFFFLQFGTLFMFLQVKKQFSPGQKNFVVLFRVETHLTVA